MRRIVLVLCAVLFTAGSAHAGPDWPMVNGCRERASFARDEASLRVPFDTVVDYPLHGSDISFAGNALYVGVASDSNIVVAYDTETDTELWRFGIPNSTGAMNCVPAVGESLVYCGGQRGFGLYAVDRATGQQRWFKPMGSLYTRNPILDGDRVYVMADSTYCLDAATGATIWSTILHDQGTPAVDDSSLYMPAGQAAIALNKFTGEVRWTTGGGSRVIEALAVGRPFVYVYNGGLIKAVYASTGQIAWSITPDGGLPWLGQGAIALSDSALFYVVWADSDGKARLCSHDRFTGVFRWNHIFDADGIFSPAVANGTVFVNTWNPEDILWGFDVRFGVVVLRDTTTHYSYQPVVADHTLFVSCPQGIRAFRNSIGVDDDAIASNVIVLQSYPNPCRDISWISIALREPSLVGISMFDLDGRAIGRGTQHPLLPGSHRLPLKTDCVAAGSYVYRVTTPHETASGRIVVVK